jgi:hypothetical protein
MWGDSTITNFPVCIYLYDQVSPKKNIVSWILITTCNFFNPNYNLIVIYLWITGELLLEANLRNEKYAHEADYF